MVARLSLSHSLFPPPYLPPFPFNTGHDNDNNDDDGRADADEREEGGRGNELAGHMLTR
jgi:hypothetical protein